MKAKQSARMEDYLEAIYALSEGKGTAHISSIGKRLSVSMPTVSSAIDRLSDQRLVKHEKYGDVKLTKKGGEIAESVYHRHLLLAQFFSEILGVSPEVSRRDACEIEHSLSSETEKRLTSFVEFILEAPSRPVWLENFSDYCENGERPKGCWERCSAL